MLEERRWRKWLYVALAVFVEWELAFAAIVAFTYGKVLSAAIPLVVAFVVVLVGAIAFGSRFPGVRWDPSVKVARRLRIALFAAYIGFAVMIVLFAVPLGFRYVGLARPSAFLAFRVANIGAIVLIVLLAVAFGCWHASLRLVERQGAE